MMIGTAPIFYRIPVTTALLQALATASYPQEETTVLRYIPPVLNQPRYRIDGMRTLDNRRIILQCFEAFKAAIVGLLSLCLNVSHVFMQNSMVSLTKKVKGRRLMDVPWSARVRDWGLYPSF